MTLQDGTLMRVKFVCYRQWIESLQNAVALWGRGRVYSAMVSGIELVLWDGFMCHRCAFMQLECDIDRAWAMP